MISSEVGVVELTRLISRSGKAADLQAELGRLKSRTYRMPVTPELCEQAALVGPAALRTLDAFHLATALSVHDELTTFIAFDRQLLQAAAAAGLPVAAPGAPELLN